MRAGAVLVRGGVRPGGGSRSSEHLLWTCPRQTRRQAQPCGWFAHLRLKGVAKWLQDLALTAALFGLGAAVDLPKLARTGGRTALLGLAATLVALVVGLAGATLAVS